MKKYFWYIKTSIKCELYYKANIVGLVITSFIVVITQICLWSTIYADRQYIDGINQLSIFLYSVIGMVVTKFLGNGMDDKISKEFVSGDIVIDLLKPQKYILKCVSQDLGRGIVHALSIGLMGAILILFAHLPNTSVSAKTVTYILICSLIAYFLYSLIGYCIGMMSVWIGRSIGLSMIKHGMFTLLGGAFIPIDFYPSWLHTIVDYLPFKYVYYAPISFLLNIYDETLFWGIIIRQTLWCLFFMGLAGVINYMAKRHIVIQGG